MLHARAPRQGGLERESRWRRFKQGLADYFLGADPDFAIALVPCCFLSILLYTRHPTRTNFIFDEQEALLANPYVRGSMPWLDAFKRDFWGLTPDSTIGSYRPLPDLVWRAVWSMGVRENPFLHHWVNVLLHGANGALVVLLVLRLTRDRLLAWTAGAMFVATAIVTEAVSGVVGIADVLAGMGALLALHALGRRLSLMALGVFGAMLMGLTSKESALCLVPLIPIAALVTAHVTHPHRPLRWVRAVVALVAAALGFVVYVEARRRLFPARLSPELAPDVIAQKPPLARLFATLLRWYAQPNLPRDPLNNPLLSASPALRVAGALRVYTRGLAQVIVPWHLSGDYSAPQEPIPHRLITVESVLGALSMVGPLLAAPVVAWRAWRSPPPPRARDVRPLVALALAWVPIAYFPVSNIPIALPTVRAERFWYFPAIFTSALIAIALTAAYRRLAAGGLAIAGVAIALAFFAMQGVLARLHANDYTNDLVFWDATRHAAPRSSKAHLNYSVMLGARGDLPGRLEANGTALALTPEWAMANVYYGDTLCRMHRPDEAYPHYVRGFLLSPDDVNLIALGLQCLWDEQVLQPDAAYRDELEEKAGEHPGTWLQYLVRDVLDRGEEQDGVDPRYRPRGYNQGPKEDAPVR